MKILLKWIGDLKVKYKLVIIYIIVGFIPILVIFFFCFGQIKIILLEKETESVNSFVSETVKNMENDINIFNNLADYIVYNNTVSQALKDYNSDSPYNQYKKLSESYDPLINSVQSCHENDISNIKVYIDDEKMSGGWNYLDSMSSIKNEKWFSNIKDDTANMWYIDQANKKVLLISRMCSFEQNSNVAGILVMELKYNKIFKAFEESQRNNYGVYILDNKNVIYSKDKFDEEFEDYKLNSYSNLDNVSDKEYMVVRKNMENTGWQVSLYKPQEYVESSFKPIVKSSVFSTLFCILACFIGIIFTSKFITRRIEQLNNSMQVVNEDYIQTEIESDAKDEIGSLIRSFKNMIERISLLINEIYDSKLAQKNYEMRALQAQINPHFLYNSLSLINWKAIEAGKEDISKITLALSSFYRTSLNKGKNTLRLGEEINNMSSYLEIQEVMHDNSFDVIIDIEEEILNYESLNLILQPIVENAIEHGIDVNEDENVKGKISVIGWAANNVINILVEDNGKGMSSKKAESILSVESKGYGVRNVNERIKMFYGQEYGLKIDSKEGKGTKVLVTFPVVKKRLDSESTNA